MSEETKVEEEEQETLPAEMQPEEITQYEEFEIGNILDDWVAEGTFDAYVYKFSKGGREVIGLTARAYEHIAKENNISVLIESVEDLGDQILIQVSAKQEIHHPKTKETKPDGSVVETDAWTEKNAMPGICCSPKQLRGKPDEFVYQRCLTKAGRGGINKLIPIPAQKKAIATMLELQGGVAYPVKQKELPSRQDYDSRHGTPKQETQQQSQDDTATATKEMFAVYRENEQKILDKGITRDEFWNGVKGFCNVESWNDMTLKQLKMISAGLRQDGFSDAINKIIKSCLPEEVNTTDATPEDEIHF